MSETFAQRVERLKDNEKHIIFKDMPKEDQACLKKVGAGNCQYLTTVLNANLAWYNGHKGDDFVLVCIYRIRPDYQPESEWSDRVFASTCDMPKDDMNNVVGVTAHCKCGHVFVDDVVHGKRSIEPEREYVDLPIEHEGLWLGVKQTEEAAPFVPFPFTHLHCLPSLPHFAGFWKTDDVPSFIYLSQVARFISEGKAVVARFRKE